MGPKTPFSEHLVSLFKKEAEDMESDLAKTRSEFDHSGIKGDEAEMAVKELLRKYLPRRYGLANGQIIDSYGGISKEVDIGICNDYHPFTYRDGGRGVLFIEGVDCCIEVKTTLTETHLENAVQNCESVRDLEPETPEGTSWYRDPTEIDTMGRVPYSIFAFESDYTRAGLIEKISDINEQLGISDKSTIDMVYVLNRGLVINSNKIDFENNDDRCEYSSVFSEPALLMFLLYLYRLMPAIQSMPNLLDSYFRPQNY